MKNPKLPACLIGVLLCFVGCMTLNAQQNERSLFLIEAPVVEKIKYTKGFSLGARFESQGAHSQEDLPEKSSSDMSTEEMLKDVNEMDKPDRDDPVVKKQMTTWNLKPMSAIRLGLNTTGEKVPEDSSWQLTNRTASLAFSEKVFAWAAPDIRYNPLYFEDVALERYGQTRGLFRQPFVSSFHFLKSAALLPYTSLHDPTDSCDYPLGYCRPGDSVSCVKQRHFFCDPWGRR